jgi:SAM-dependent methyltransferase
MTSTRNITYLSAPAEVSMADRWFEVAAIDHFWVRRRFDVFRRLAGRLIVSAREIAEIGCGHGLLQLQIEEAYGREVTGFDLNEFALNQNLSRLSTICCYDIHQKDPALQERYDLILLFDVLEHIADEDRFLAAVIFHLAPGGKLVMNVPAGQWAYSVYDGAAGHVRRYSSGSLREAAERNNLEVAGWSYWGLPLVPALMLRKFWLSGNHNKDKIISAGFDSRTSVINQLLGLVSSCEPIPQTFLGTSLMAVLQGRHSQK